MSIVQNILTTTTALSDVEFSYSTTSDFNFIDTMDYDCSAIVMDATVIYFEIKNLQVLLKTGKRLAARVYKMYYHALMEVCKKTDGILNCYSPSSFLLIYPKEKHDISYVVSTALKIADLFSNKLREPFEKHCHINFSMGIDNGNILGTKAISDNKYQHIAWFGSTIDKAQTICKKSIQPFFVGVSGTVFHHLNEDLLTTTKRILGIKKRVEIWERVSYEFENVKKHLYQTNFHKDFDEEQPDA